MSEDRYSIVFKTILSDAYFYEDEDNDRFDEWIGEQLSNAGLFAWEFEDFPVGIAGITKLSLYVNDFTYKHELEVVVKVDDDSHTFDELADNDALFNYLERDLAYRIIDELNKVCEDISFPMNNDSFNDLKFDDNEFYSMLMYSRSSGYFVSPYIKNEQFEIYRDFEVYL